MTLEEARARLDALQKKRSAYDHALALISYDGVTTAPKGTAVNRAQTMGVLSEELYRLNAGEETAELLQFLEENDAALDARQRRTVFLLGKSIRQMKCIPMQAHGEGAQRLAALPAVSGADLCRRQALCPLLRAGEGPI